MDVMDARRFVCYAEGSEDMVVGVREFHLAVALLEEGHEVLSQAVPSQWGPAHLFDLCLTFGHFDTALAMAERGVEGCRMEAYHLRRSSASPSRNSRSCSFTGCRGWQTCTHCCFGFPVHKGIWMADWDEPLRRAAWAAREDARQPIVHGTLKALTSRASLPFDISEEAIVHLLDLAILTGDREASTRIARQSELRPLRRWSVEQSWGGSQADFVLGQGADRFQVSVVSMCFEIACEPRAMFLAALAAGARLQNLEAAPRVDLREFLVLAENSGPASFREIEDLLPRPENPRRGRKSLGSFFLAIFGGVEGLRMDCLQHTGLALPELIVDGDVSSETEDTANQRCDFSLLDIAIFAKQADCAAWCAEKGVELSAAGCRILQQCLEADPACRDAASAAAVAALITTWKSSVVAKGVATLQAMEKMSEGTPFPPGLATEVLKWSMDVPKIIEQLSLWDVASAWSGH